MLIIFRLWKLFWNNLIKDYYGIFLSFFLTFFFMIMSLIFKSNDPFVLPSAIMINIIRNGLSNFYRTLAEFKNSGFTERLNNTPLSKVTFNFSIVSFNFIIVMLSCLWLFIPAILFFPQQRIMLKNINWLIVSIAIILAIILSNLIAVFLSLAIKRDAIAQIISLLLYFLPLYLLGLAIPLETLTKYPAIMNFSYILPQRYVTDLIHAGWVNSTNMKYTFINSIGQEITIDLGFNNIIIPILISISIIIVLSLLIILFFYMQKRKSY